MVHNPWDILSNLLAVASELHIDLVSGFIQHLRRYFGPKFLDSVVQVFLLLDLVHLDILTGSRDENGRLLERILSRQIQNGAALHFCIGASAL